MHASAAVTELILNVTFNFTIIVLCINLNVYVFSFKILKRSPGSKVGMGLKDRKTFTLYET